MDQEIYWYFNLIMVQTDLIIDTISFTQKANKQYKNQHQYLMGINCE